MIVTKEILLNNFKAAQKAAEEDKNIGEDSLADRYTEEDERRMDIIGQNGNDGEHYDTVEEEFKDFDINKDGKIDQSELDVAKNRLKELQDSIRGVTKSSNRVDKALKEIKKLQSFINNLNDDTTIKY